MGDKHKFPWTYYTILNLTQEGFLRNLAMGQGLSLLRSIGFISSLHRIASLDEIIIGIVLSSLFINLLGLVFPIVLLQVYDRVIPNSSINTLMLLVFGTVVFLIVEFLLNMGRTLVTSWTDSRFEHKLVCEAFQQIVNSKTINFEVIPSGTYLEHLGAIATIKSYYGGQSLGVILDLIFILIYLSIVYYLANYLVLVPICMVIILGFLILNVSQEFRKELHVREVTDQRKSNFIIEVLARIHTVKSFGIEAAMLRRYERLQDRSAYANHTLGLKNNKTTLISNTVNQITTLLTLSIGSFLVIEEKLTVGSLAACVLLANRALQPIGRAMYMWIQSQAVTVAKRHTEFIVDLPQESIDKPPLPTVSGNISVESLCFQYPGSKKPIFTDFSFDIKSGETVSIDEKNSSGRTTLLYIMAGLFKPNLGRVLMDGHDIHAFNLKSLRKQIAFLPQHGHLFSGTILENLTMFRPEYIDKAMQLSEKLDLVSDLNRMPNGYETMVGRNAVDILPLGLQQRICIARALIEEPPVILFDEANNGVDLRSDTILKKIIMELKGKSTVVLVSQRPSILALADRRIRFQDEDIQDKTL